MEPFYHSARPGPRMIKTASVSYRVLPLLGVFLLGSFAGSTAVIVEHRYWKERFWDDNPGREPPFRHPWFYQGKQLKELEKAHQKEMAEAIKHRNVAS